MKNVKRSPEDLEKRSRAIERIFDEQGWENADWLEAWDGEILEDLREVLSDQQYQTLVDRLQDRGIEEH